MATASKNNTSIITNESILSFVRRSVVEHGAYVNNHRHIPSIIDGLKPSYRRIIWTTLEEPPKLTKVATLAGICGGKYTPHSPDSLPAVVSELVRMKLFTGQGSHGSKSIYAPWDIDPAASRYIEARIQKEWRSVWSKLVPLVEFKESELDSRYKEPVYLPTPVPISLLFSSSGIGVGIATKVPNFSLKSLLDARENNDYKLLDSNGDLELVKSKSELKDIWTKGVGTVTYRFAIAKDTYEKYVGYSLTGDSRFISITKLPTEFKDKKRKVGKKEVIDQGWLSSNKVVMIDRSDRKGNKKIFFAINPRYKKSDKVTDKELFDVLDDMREISTKYTLTVSNGELSYVENLKTWLDTTYNNFDRLVKLYKTTRLVKIKRQILVIKHSVEVANYILKNPSSSSGSVAKSLKLEESLVSEILRKSISVLMKTNADKDTKVLEEEIKNIQKIKTSDFYENLVE